MHECALTLFILDIAVLQSLFCVFTFAKMMYTFPFVSRGIGVYMWVGGEGVGCGGCYVVKKICVHQVAILCHCCRVSMHSCIVSVPLEDKYGTALESGNLHLYLIVLSSNKNYHPRSVKYRKQIKKIRKDFFKTLLHPLLIFQVFAFISH